MSDANQLAPGTSIAGKFSIIQFLRKDSSGIDVYLAEDKERQEKVLFRSLLIDTKTDPTVFKRMVRSFELASKLEHPNILPAYEYGASRNIYYFITAYMEGAYLNDYLQPGQFVEEADSITIAYILADALEYAWQQVQLIYRDLKPETILINEEGSPVLTDFGLAKSANKDAKSSSLTLTGSFVGDPKYMSPEQIYGNKVLDCRSDIYCLGLVLYRMLTGQPAFESKVAMQLVDAQLNRQPTPVIEVNPEVTPQCSALIDKLLKKPREERPKDWTMVKADCNALLNDEMPPSLKETTGYKDTKWVRKYIDPKD